RIGSGHCRRIPPERPASEPSQKADRPMPIEVTGPSPVMTTGDVITRDRGGSLLSAALRTPAEHEADMRRVAPALHTEEPVPAHDRRAHRDSDVEVVSDPVEDPAAGPDAVRVIAVVLDPVGLVPVDIGIAERESGSAVRIPALAERPDLPQP